MAKRFLRQSLYYVNQEQVGEEIETGGGSTGTRIATRHKEHTGSFL